MRLVEVISENDKKEFLSIPLKIYKNIPQWVRPLDNDIESVFDPELNSFFAHGKLIRWILKNTSDETIGRVAAFINDRTAGTFEQPTGAMGFFECANDPKAAFMLFDACKRWLSENGMEAMDGPVNFGENDRWWGLVTEGFDESPLYCHNYNPLYYKNFFENYGFKTYFNQYYYRLDLQNDFLSRYKPLAERAEKRYDLHYECIDLKQKEKYSRDFCTVYNKGWITHHNFKAMTFERAMAIMHKLEPVMDEKIMTFTYAKGEPCGILLMMPELNTIFRKMQHGKLSLYDKMRFLWYLKTGACRKIYGFVFGVIPEFQRKGVESYMVVKAALQEMERKKYDLFDFAWVGDFNPVMVSLVESFGVKKVKILATYRKLFDESKPFKRSPIIYHK